MTQQEEFQTAHHRKKGAASGRALNLCLYFQNSKFDRGLMTRFAEIFCSSNEQLKENLPSLRAWQDFWKTWAKWRRVRNFPKWKNNAEEITREGLNDKGGRGATTPP